MDYRLNVDTDEFLVKTVASKDKDGKIVFGLVLIIPDVDKLVLENLDDESFFVEAVDMCGGHHSRTMQPAYGELTVICNSENVLILDS